MTGLEPAILAVAALLVVYLLLLAALILAGRSTDARAWAGFVPDCIVLARRLVGDERVPRRAKLVLGALVVYLAIPIDIVPDFLPVVGHLDDAIIVALVLRHIVRDSGGDLVREHWPGPERSLHAILRLAQRLA